MRREGEYDGKTARIEIVPNAIPLGDRRGVLTMLAGPRPGMLISIGDPQLTIGRNEESMVALDDESLSRRHARFFRMRSAYFVEDLGSTNGTLVDDHPVREAVVLADGALIQLGKGVVLRFTLQDEAAIDAQRRLYESTVRDALTGLHNRLFLDERLESEFSYAKRHGATLTVLFVDADHFKKVNDTLGHAAGDEVLREIGAFLQSTMRSEDIVARYGGEEFVVVVRTIPSAGVLAVAERIRTGIEALQIPFNDQTITVTASIGVATQSPERPFESVQALLAVADAALYRAKETGRNRVVVA